MSFPNERSINDLVADHEARLASASDEQVLAELGALEPLPDETDSGWNEPPFPLFETAGYLVALADEIGRRQLEEGIPLVLAKACFGDPGETMRGLRHALEAAVDERWERLAEMCVEATKSKRAGTRLWATTELGVLRDPVTLPALVARLSDVEARVRAQAAISINMLGQHHAGAVAALIPVLRDMASTDPSGEVRRACESALDQTA